ncbi:type II toxin-antitoxin system RelE/ParE family toxin [Acidisoma cladoniae]|jgi:proteic killer suppression protein|uniref:type II toxin-antitoxin system RelE/ParE family toxin n=1 Tax=Acidisoma cladoniae TaxID=3040935 RepID=UPI00254CFDB8|nr:type II toxin-antitoxin system RelE/ParE family toxin [Acidisoma sp. PAMC 29798]
MIKSFRDTVAAALFLGQVPKMFPADVARRAHTRLVRVDTAAALDDLKVSPSHHLEALSKDRAGQHSIRINLQWRVCFIWQDGNADSVEVVDYH